VGIGTLSTGSIRNMLFQSLERRIDVWKGKRKLNDSVTQIIPDEISASMRPRACVEYHGNKHRG